MDRWSEWYDSLPKHTKEYLEKQPTWHNSDLVKCAVVAFVVGFLMGWAI